jgi:PKD repeat protein
MAALPTQCTFTLGLETNTMRSSRAFLLVTGVAALAACGGDGGNGPSNTAPTAAFTNPPSCTLLACNFDATPSTDGDGTVTAWSWNFDDASSGSNTANTQQASHTFSAANTYTVSLTVTDNDGATNSVSHEVTVSDVPNQAPTADFTADCNSKVCTFTNASTDADGTLTSSWNFGDGSAPVAETSPSHNYSAATGTTFTVTLTVTDDDGATNTKSLDVDVSPPATLTCGSTADCSLTLDAATHVTVTLVNSNCQLSGNTFKVVITTPGNAPVEETLFDDGCNQTLFPPGTSFQLQTNAVFAAGTSIQAQVISGGTTLEIPPALRLAAGSAYPSWTLEFDDGAKAVEPPNGAPDFDDLIIRIDAIP